MNKSIYCCLALIATAAVNTFAQGQDLNAYMQSQLAQTEAMMQQYYSQMDQLGQQMQNTEQQIVSANMNDPRVQQMYQQYCNQGMPYGQMSFQQFAYLYGATAGFTPEGIRHYNQTTNQIQTRETAAMREYQAYVNNLWAATNAERSEVYNRQQRDVGDLMSGNTYYADPNTGVRYYLPYTAQNGQPFTDSNGRTFVMGANGSYQFVDANGYTHQLNPVWNR